MNSVLVYIKVKSILYELGPTHLHPPPPPPTPIRGCAAQQGMVFAFLSLEQGLHISVSVWNRVYFLPFRLWNTVGVTILLPESRHKQTLLLFQLGSRCMFTQTRRFRLDGQFRLTFFSLEQGIYFHNFVWNRVANLRLFSLEQGQVLRLLRHAAAHPHPKLRGEPPPPPTPLQDGHPGTSSDRSTFRVSHFRASRCILRS